MRKNIWINLCLGALLLSATACKTKKVIAELPKAVVQPYGKSPLAQVANSDFYFDTYTTKAKTNLKLDGKEYDLTLNIRIKKNDTIWISASALGFEAGRLLITKDSIKILDRIQSRYMKKPFSFINQYTNTVVDYPMIESILVGNTLQFWYRKETSITDDTTGFLLSGQKKVLSYRAQFNTLTKIVELILRDASTDQKLQVNYSQFIQNGEKHIPTHLLLNSTNSGKTLTADMMYSVPELNTVLEFPFSVPKRFSVIE
jgi:hypothetical protein